MPHMGTTVIHMDSPDFLARQIAAEVRSAMTAAGISQREMARATNIPLVTLGRRLTGAGKPMDMVELATIAHALGISVTELVLRAERRIASAAA